MEEICRQPTVGWAVETALATPKSFVKLATEGWPFTIGDFLNH
jgi:hypothetical protein